MAAKRPHPMLSSLKQLLAKFEAAQVSPVDCLILDHIKTEKGDSQVGIRRMLQRAGVTLSTSNVSRHISRLEDLRYAMRRPGPDQRTKSVVLSRLGREALEAYESRLQEFFPVEQLAVPSLLIACPSCERTLRLANSKQDMRFTCPGCKQAFHLRFVDGKCEVRPAAVDATAPHRTDPPHVLLGVGPHASRDDVAEARRKLLRIFHPDNFHHLGPDFVELATRKSQALNHAYDVLVGRR